MAARTYRTTEPMSTTQTLWTLRNLVLLIIVAVLAIVVMRWLGQMRIQNRVAIQPAPIVESVPAQQPVHNSIAQPIVSRQDYEHQRCENLGYTDVVFEERPYGWLVTCKG